MRLFSILIVVVVAIIVLIVYGALIVSSREEERCERSREKRKASEYTEIEKDCE